ncbi:putative nuclease HARBI1 [Cydia pomonella]|uniref:putative nuclease HARBI1 n=1 Tax=Cydia pomonella TaxID=82600 RepID=UPI002ADE4489|nr:putative nuclease HARBI1 [Cydia pomonella]
MARYHFFLAAAAMEEKQNRKLQRRSIRDACNPFDMPDEEFRHIYRVRKELALYLCAELDADLKPQHGDGLPAHVKVLTSLHLLADGSYQRGTGQDHGLSIAQSTVSRYLDQFVTAVNRRHIDCTQVQIFPPPLPHGVQFLNRKGIHWLNVQLIADVNCKILSVNARFPGRVHDSFIFNNSSIKDELRRLHSEHIGDYFLLGDSGYALEPWLMTPVLNAAPNSPEERYTAWHCRVRNTIERTNGYLKNIFRCLGHDRVLHYSPAKASAIIYTCCTLYNIMQHYKNLPITGEPEAEMEGGAARGMPYPQNGLLLRVAQEKRALIINNYFA